jgi:hypothetical protein
MRSPMIYPPGLNRAPRRRHGSGARHWAQADAGRGRRSDAPDLQVGTAPTLAGVVELAKPMGYGGALGLGTIGRGEPAQVRPRQLLWLWHHAIALHMRRGSVVSRALISDLSVDISLSLVLPAGPSPHVSGPLLAVLHPVKYPSGKGCGRL